MNDLGNSISKAFTFNAYDIPFALVYFCSAVSGISGLLADDTGLERRSASDSSNYSEFGNTDRTRLIYTLKSTVGVPEGHLLAPLVVEIQLGQVRTGNIDLSTINHVWPFMRMATEQTEINVNLPAESLEGFRYQGWPDIPSSAVAVPIFGAREMNGKDLMTGMLIMGINPRRTFDEDYLSWIRLCSRHIAAAMNLTQSVEEAAQKAEELATLNRNRTAFFNR